ncbi:MAG: hypothetical protein RMK29_05630 [Myxococcales bacterium]|nr:hypothetical protein [Myxococcota bacterium]MDW8281170.1 hypothetical protein [Myxococcales bacterium]
MQKVRRAVAEALHVHPRIRDQQLDGAAQVQALAEALPEFVPFRGHTVEGVVAILDWDHHLPSRSLLLRLHLCYTAAGEARLRQLVALRTEEIGERNLFPEFDVPDYAGLPGDEVYECELRPDLSLVGCRLVSPWRRDVAAEEAALAVAAVRRSSQFAQLRSQHKGRPAALGDLEVVAWTPPCESGYSRWTLDVWWLTAFDGRVGRGLSFLVDLEQKPGERVVAQREFHVRAG